MNSVFLSKRSVQTMKYGCISTVGLKTPRLDGKMINDNYFRQWLKMGIDFPGMEKNIANMKNMFNFFQVQADGTKENIKTGEDDET